MIKNILLILLIMYNCLSAFSQVTGKIVDKTNFALEYATAAIYNQETNEFDPNVFKSFPILVCFFLVISLLL
jgi:hypothetical protein